MMSFDISAYLPLGNFPHSNMSAQIWCVPAMAIHRTSSSWMAETKNNVKVKLAMDKVALIKRFTSAFKINDLN